MGNYLKVSEDRFEQSSDTFYGRMNALESKIVRETVDDVAGYMRNLERPFLIAGVGSILRLEDPEGAKDIDLAVVGLKYTRELGSARTHDFKDVIDFTTTVRQYFMELTSRLKEGRKEYNLLQGSGASFSTGSSPFEDWNDGFGGRKEDDSTVEARTQLGNFGWYDSKGLQVQHSGLRPVDIQFVFNQTPEEWRTNQYKLKDSPTARPIPQGTRSYKFSYAVLLEHP